MTEIKILLVAINAKNIHKSLAPWCLKAYCEKNTQGCEINIQENNINENSSEVLNGIFKYSPDLVGFSCYIWNIELILKITKTIKKLLPSCVIVLGGPEVSFERSIEVYPCTDYIVQGAGEEAFCELMNSLTIGEKPEVEIISGCDNNLCNFPSPYTDEYFASFKKDKMSSIENQLVYYESSRGCPFSCAYCLSSATVGVQYLPLETVKDDMLLILSHGAKCIKFVDRTFNADKKRAADILEFIYNLNTDCTFHFEAAADLFEDELLNIISKMPVGRVQFEIGIQSINPQTLSEVCRKTNTEKALSNISRLTAMNNCHIHVDLIAGLPFETLGTFAGAINGCLAVKPHMLQLGFLKFLKGSAIREQKEKFNYVFDDYTPYEVLKSNCLSYGDIITLKGIERVIDKFYNSGMFVNTLEYATEKLFENNYDFFYRLSIYCENIGNIKVSLKNSYTILLDFLLKYGEKNEVEHFIKLDCLTFDFKGMLPDSIVQQRDRTIEHELKKTPELINKSIRAEYFELDNKKRLFVYDSKNSINKAYRTVELH